MDDDNIDKDIINHPWGESVNWTGDIKGYSPSHWLSGPPRAPYGYSGEVPLEIEQQPESGVSPMVSGALPYSNVYPAPGVIFAPQPYNQQTYSEQYDSSGLSNLTNPQNQNRQQMQQQGHQQDQNTNQTNPPAEKTDWYKVLYTGSIILMGVGSIAVAVIQYKMYSEKHKQNRNGSRSLSESDSRS